MKFFKTTSNLVGHQFSLRIDSKYRGVWDKKELFPFSSKECEKIKIADILVPLPIKKLKKGELDSEYNILNISEIEPKYGRITNSTDAVDSIGSDKTLLNKADIIISKLVMSKGYIFTNEKNVTNLIGSTELIPYRLRNKNFDVTFLRHLLLLDEYLDIYSRLETGKTPSQKRVNPMDFLQLLIPSVSVEIQKDIGEKILSIESEIDRLNEQIVNKNSIINEVFANEFGINLDSFRLIKNVKVDRKESTVISKSFDLRFSYKYTSTKYDLLLEAINQHPTKPLKTYTKVPIQLGASISPINYDEGGDSLYISMSSLRNWTVDTESSSKVSETYYEENLLKNSLQLGDIIIARSGEGTIGKVGILKEDVQAIFADFTMRVRILEQYSAKYFYYYFCSDLFQYFVEKEKKGLGNNTNVFPNQLKRFPIIDISRSRQLEIVNIIDQKLEIVTKAEEQVKEYKKQIRNLILSTFLKTESN
ncbi:hypothetical protein COE92_21440 [Bacillus wiedmannii]|nr:hypothetical protein COE92_21440 [Bacillus wiedmannii]